MKTDYIMQKKTNKGLKRDHNEDSVIIMNHPNHDGIKLLAIADGMGGRKDGEIASKYIVDSLCEWFVHTEVELLNQTEQISKTLSELISKWNAELIQMYGENRLGTTLTMALVNFTKTIILNIGDSRCYVYKDKNLIQVTEDDSEVWMYYKYGKVDKEDLRYFSTSNIINACIGLSYELCLPTILVQDNEDYDLLLLVTDGITDLLTDEKIKFLIHNNRKEQILDALIQEAIYVDQELFVPTKLKDQYFENFFVPEHGKDDATAAIFIKN